MARTVGGRAQAAKLHQLRWRSLVDATGLAWVRLEGKPAGLKGALQLLRVEMERHGGSLVAQHRWGKMADFEYWGDAGDALPLMKAVKARLDPKNTLNPGRFVGGI
jgi:glycolate oxidase FAD binding subunit